jgi:spermidine synthase
MRQYHRESTPLPFDRVGGELRFLTNDVLQGLFELPADLRPMDAEINRLDNQALVHYYDSEWNRSD